MRATAGRVLGVSGVGALLAALCALVALAFGEQALDLGEAFTAGTTAHTILLSLRLPRVVLAAMVGAALAASGSMLQALLRNPLADPFVLGVSGGAALGATIAIALGVSTAGLAGLSGASVFALVGAVASTGLVLTVGRASRGESATGTLLAGVIFNAFALAAIIFIKALVAPDKLGEVLFWLAGALGHESWSALAFSGTVITLSVLAMWALAPRINLLMLGDDDAQSLGVDVRRTRLALLLLASAAVSAAVALSGLVGFVGLLVPHLARLGLGADQRLTLPASALLGASFLMLADLAARLMFRVFHTEPPVGVITALLGGPLFLLLMVRR
ncbi:MAG: iron ABC transporter permease [Myxococcus sp.]|nr:iron ABC transporter permease [Myxococcus sp.]